MRSYPVKENSICSAVSERLGYKQTNKQTSCYFIIKIEMVNKICYILYSL